MPLYAIKCDQCGAEQDIFLPLARFNDLPDCCGQQMRRKICAPMTISDIQPYKSMITGEMITSRSQHRDHLKAHGCTEVGNEKMEPKKTSWIEQKQQKEALRKEVAARLDNI